MNRKLGMIGSLVSFIAVVLFAIFMLVPFDFGSFFVCIFLSLGFAMMISAFANECDPDVKAAAYMAMICAAVYCGFILLVYFAQITSVRNDGLSDQALQVIDYSRSGLLFNYDLLGYGLMALSTFFIGLTLKDAGTAEKWLKWLLLLHGIFFLPCLIIPVLGIFSGGDKLTGVLILEFWCVYFAPICILSYFHFRKRTQ